MARRPRQPRLPGVGPAGRAAVVARMRRDTETTIRALRAGGALERADSAAIGLVRTLAEQIDAEVLASDPSRFVIGTLAGRYLEALRDVRGHRTPTDDSFERAMAALAAQVAELPGDTPR